MYFQMQIYKKKYTFVALMWIIWLFLNKKIMIVINLGLYLYWKAEGRLYIYA